MQFDLAEARLFPALIDPEFDFVFQTFDDDDSEGHDKNPKLAWTTRDFDALARMNDRHAGIFVTINKVEGDRRQAQFITKVRALFADFDGTPLPDRWELEPSIIIATSAGKFHVYWLCPEGFPKEEFAEAQRAIINHYHTDPKPKDLPRVMRIPGFWHCKGEPVQVHMLKSPGHHYTAAQLRSWIDSITPPAQEPAQLPQARPKVNLSSINGGADRYVMAAVNRALDSIASAAKGNRNDTLNTEAFGIFGLVKGGYLPEHVTEDITRAALSTGSPASEIKATIQSAWSKAVPRTIPALRYDSNRNFGPEPNGPAPWGEPVEPKRKSRVTFIPFADIRLDPDPPYLVRDIIPSDGLVLVWGPPKCGKTFWVFDLMMHVALGREYRGHRVKQGGVVYCSFEGQRGFQGRVEAFRQRHHVDEAPLFMQPATLDLVRERKDLIDGICETFGEGRPAAVVLDTLNRSMRGSESKDEDMSAYINAADAIREAFGCVVIIVHHSGIEASRPRGHTALSGAVAAQLAIRREEDGTIIAIVELMKDGNEGYITQSVLETVEVGRDVNGDPIFSCVLLPASSVAAKAKSFMRQKMSDRQRNAITVLNHVAAECGKRAPAEWQLSHDIVVVPIDRWRDELLHRGDIDHRRQERDLARLREALKARFLIGERDGFVWLAVPGA